MAASPLHWRSQAWRWLLAGVVAVAAPKCFLCVAGYVIVLTGVGWAGPELCGGSAKPGFPFFAVNAAVAAVCVAAALLVRVAGRWTRQCGRS